MGLVAMVEVKNEKEPLIAGLDSIEKNQNQKSKSRFCPKEKKKIGFVWRWD